MRNLICASIGVLAMAHAPSLSARPMTEVDLATMKRLGAPAVSPDGKWVVYQVTDTDLEANSRSTGLYILSLSAAGAAPVRIADTTGHSEHSPTFSVDGMSVYFLSGVSGSEQVWNVPAAGGEATQVSAVAADVAGFKLSPDNKRIALWGDIAKKCQTFGCKADDAGKTKATGRLYTEGFVRHWDHWETPGTYSRVFAFDMVDGKISGLGKAMDGGLVGDSPSKPFGGGEEIAWSADSNNVMFTLRKADKFEPRSTNLDIYSAPASGGDPVNLTKGNKATDSLPTASPNGRYIAWAAMARPGYESDRMVVRVMDVKTRKVRALTKDWDRSVGSIAWAPNSKSLIVTVQDVLDHPAYSVSVKNGKVKRLTRAGNVGNVTPLADGGLIYTKNDLNAPNDLYHLDSKGTVTQLTEVNKAVLAAVNPVEVERFSFAGAEGDKVWGQIIKPAGTTGKLPVAFLVHGGPQGSFGNSWSSRWNPKVMASQGYIGITVDFHGSVGYGQKFTDSINKDWGGKPLVDLKLGLAAAAKIEPLADANNACALGASYGGYMMNWIAGNWSDQFKCIVNHDGVFDLRSMALSTEELWFDEWDHGGPWWTRPNREKWNPVNYVTNWKTPTLIIQGEKDFRIPTSQSLMAFTALQRQDIPSELLIFPDENHWVLKPQNSVQWHNVVFEWLEKWTKKEAE